MNKINDKHAERTATTDSGPWATRRAVLAGGGAAALGALAGCAALDGLVDRASEQVVTARTASPAAFYDGDDTLDSSGAGDFDAFRPGPADVRYVPPTLRVESQRIDLEGWSTSTQTKAQDYNSSRSNKPSSIWVPDPDADGDGLDDGIGTLATVLDVERALSVHLDRALAAVERRSSAEADDALDAFIAATTEVRTELDGCPSDVCVTVRENADGRKGLAEDASDAVGAGEWDLAVQSLGEARRIVDGDIERLERDLDSDGDGLLDATEPLYAYLDGEPTVGEGFVVSLPDARLRGGGVALADEITPRRVVDYFLGERDPEGCADSDRTAAVHRDLACRNLLSTQLAEETKKKRVVAAFETDGGVVVTGAVPEADESAEMLFVSVTDAVTTPENLDSWGEERTAGPAAVTSTLVCPVVATPADCPCPLPGLFYVRRIRHDDQLLFAGGWVVDDGALYEDAATLLVGDGPNVVAGVTRSDIEDGGVDLEPAGDDLLLRKRPGRAKYGNITLSRSYNPTDDYLPTGADPVCRDDGNSYWAVQSRQALAEGTGDCDDSDSDRNEPPSCVVTAMDAPVLHLVEAAEASNEVKFKAGAELSKAVN